MEKHESNDNWLARLYVAIESTGTLEGALQAAAGDEAAHYAYDSSEPRDTGGQWSSGGGSGASILSQHPKPAPTPAQPPTAPRRLSLHELFSGLHLSNNRQQAAEQLHGKIAEAKKMAMRYRGLYRRAMTLLAKTGNDKYRKQAEMYRNSARREQKKPGFYAGVLERIQEPSKHWRDEEPARYVTDASGHEHDAGGLFTGPGGGAKTPKEHHAHFDTIGQPSTPNSKANEMIRAGSEADPCGSGGSVGIARPARHKAETGGR